MPVSPAFSWIIYIPSSLHSFIQAYDFTTTQFWMSSIIALQLTHGLCRQCPGTHPTFISNVVCNSITTSQCTAPSTTLILSVSANIYFQISEFPFNSPSKLLAKNTFSSSINTFWSLADTSSLNLLHLRLHPSTMTPSLLFWKRFITEFILHD